ncbi:helix-turn-helix domain-containing protein [Halorussus caseinilyticus]|uniref:Helix-turn-helix domain-containing protein n=1 Tax=Halorussus caseinilyticus TaxID=3034025 RepID=A0ABD5WFE0_9EURY|nr:helix-turn-helix domain-containing protein [Halorussus sp. DT72]
MRAFSFALEYDAGTDPVADAFRGAPDLYGHSLACTVTPENCWRVDRLTGPTDPLERAADAYAESGHAADCLGPADCAADHRTEVLQRDPSTRILFTSWERTDACRSIPHLALDHLGPGVLFATERHGPRYEWHVLLPSDDELGSLSDAIRAATGTGVRFALRQVTDESAWLSAYSGRPALPYAHYEAMAAAVERGYYETPRAITVSELADELDVPRSTLSYRLRRAEAELARSFVGNES